VIVVNGKHRDRVWRRQIKNIYICPQGE